MIKSKIQIENGDVFDSYEQWGFIYIDADERTAPPEKEDAVTTYAGEPGEHRDGRTMDAPFDYKVAFIVAAPNKDLANVNSRIADFNAAVRGEKDGVKVKKEISFYNLLNRVKITGYPEPISEPKKVIHLERFGELDYAQIELKIRVSDPRKCDFDLFVGDGANFIRNSKLLTLDGWLVNHASMRLTELKDGLGVVAIYNPEDKNYASIAQRFNLEAGDYTFAGLMRTADYHGFSFARAEVQGMKGYTRMFTKIASRLDDVSKHGVWQRFVYPFALTEQEISQCDYIQIAFTIESKGMVSVTAPILLKGHIDNPQWQANPEDNTPIESVALLNEESND